MSLINRQSLVCALFVALVALNTPGALAQVEADREAIQATVLDYFQGQKLRDLERLQAAFDTSVAAMIGLSKNDDGEITPRRLELAPILPRWAEGEPNAEAANDYEFLSLEVLDGRMATVLFRSGTSWFDALTLLKIEGTWKIVSKAYVPQEVGQ